LRSFDCNTRNLWILIFKLGQILYVQM
jgi:hypothetical protein